MQLIALEDPEQGKAFSFPRLTQLGRDMAIAFENVIKDTAYYKEYRLLNTEVPKAVLEEYAEKINLSMNGFTECKRLLQKRLLSKGHLSDCIAYLQFLYHEMGIHELPTREARRILFDMFSSRADNMPCPEKLQPVITGWEIVIGRQYLTCGIEMIWKEMLFCLQEPLTIDTWFEEVLSNSDFSFSLDDKLKSILAGCVFSHEQREERIENSRRTKAHNAHMVEDGMRIALSMYNRFYQREDLADVENLLYYGRGKTFGKGSLAFSEWFEMVDSFKDCSIREFLLYVMTECIVEQHKRTCRDKMMRATGSVDGFYFEFVDDKYIKNEHDFQVDFQGIRLIQLMQVMKDLDMFSREEQQ